MSAAESHTGQGSALADAIDPMTPEQWQAITAELGLSPQQVRVAAALLRGMRDKQIAREMDVDVSTVRTHLSRIFQKTGTADRVELILRIFRLAMRVR